MISLGDHLRLIQCTYNVYQVVCDCKLGFVGSITFNTGQSLEVSLRGITNEGMDYYHTKYFDGSDDELIRDHIIKWHDYFVVQLQKNLNSKIVEIQQQQERLQCIL